MAEQERPEGEALLHIYLNDHRAANAGALAAARRSAKNNQGTPFAQVIDDLRADLEADARTLDDVLEALGVGKNVAKVGLALAGELVGRFKLNGRLRDYSPLSRVLELEAVASAVSGKRLLWSTLAQLQADEPRLASFDFDALAGRAEDQSERLQRLHRDAVPIAFAGRDEDEAVELPGGVEPSPTRPPGDSPWVNDAEGADGPAPSGGPGVTPSGTSPGNADTSVFEDDSATPAVRSEDELQSADEDTFPPSV